MNRHRRNSLLAVIALAAAPLAGHAQPAAKVPVVAVVWTAPLPAVKGLQEHILRGLRDLGHTPGQTVIVEFHSSDGTPSRLPALVGELVSRQVDVIVAPSNTVAKLAQDMTKTIPVVMVDVTNPLGLGLIASLDRPGGNVTGTYALEAVHYDRRIELLRQAGVKRGPAAVFISRGNPQAAAHRQDIDLAERALGVKIELVELDGPADIEQAMAAAAQRGITAVLLLPAGGEPVLFAHRRRLIKAAAKLGMPTAGGPNTAAAGAVIGMGSRSADHYVRCAGFIDKILKGANPAELRVEQAASFELVVNQKAALALGLTVPPAVLRRADRVID